MILTNKPFQGGIFSYLLLFSSVSFSAVNYVTEPQKNGANLQGENHQSEQLEMVALEQHYPFQDIDGMINRLVSKGDKRRIMINPKKLSFEGELKAAPKEGEFSLIYDSLKLWGVDPLPNVSHSSYIKTPLGKVIPVYLDELAAKRLNDEAVGMKATFYGLHVYNYEHGPRLLILSYKASSATQ